MEILIIGAGNGGLAFGGMLIERGFKVNLFDNQESVVQPIKKNNKKITIISNGVSKQVKFNLATNNLQRGINNVDYIFIVVPAYAHRSVAIDLSKVIKENQVVVLHPGRTGGAMEFKKIFNSVGKKNIIAEAETMLFAARKNSSTEIVIHGIKKSVGIASLPKHASQEISNKLNKLLPHFHNSIDVISTSLSNIGAVFHPIPFLFNLTRIDNKESFKYYHEGISPSIANLLESLDKERLSIAQAFGLQIPSAREWVNFNYGVAGKTLYESIQMNNIYKDILAPTEINSRYIMEDIPMGLVPMKELAQIIDLETPIINSIINLASKLYNFDFIKNGRRIEHMEIEPMFPALPNINK
ncbi:MULTISPECIES: NAD/NADP octopine/nopaline dehydrogenase family protein [unclassified Oceanobacillus]|uniref:NAD/NADP octopine/nopaline dehydrogenase family protein n=1 Tax=unclassified Oceanobacillus TaxID=2630292 RepID=UPI0018DB1DA8|nr:NAD/NADP octopine/nopaline dehydrogenase family protein [Oceanobacillus sp. AG]